MKAATESARVLINNASTCKIECEVTKGIGIHIVGMRDRNIKETILRVATSLQACGYQIPGKKIIVNIASGSGPLHVDTDQLDLAIAISLLAASGQITEGGANALDKFYIVGELALDGEVRRCSNGAKLAELAEKSQRPIIMPAQSAMEAWDKLGSTIYAVESLEEALDVVRGHGERYLLWNTRRFNEALDKVLAFKKDNGKQERYLTKPSELIDVAIPSLGYGGSSITAVFLGERNSVLGSEVYVDGVWQNAISANTKDILLDATDRKGIRGMALIVYRDEGTEKPDGNDIKQVAEFKERLNALNLSLVDVLIVSGNKYYSFAEETFDTI